MNENNPKYQLNTKQVGEAVEFLTSLSEKSVNVAFLDPQYEKVANVVHVDYPLSFQTDYQIQQIVKEVSRVIKPSGFLFLWVNKALLGSDRIVNWLLQAPSLKIVDSLVWYKRGTLGLGSWLRSNAEFCFILQNHPTNSKLFTNRSFGSVWEEASLSTQRRDHPHQKPFFLIKSLIEATTQEGDLVVDPCAGSFVVLEACQSIGRQFLGVDLTYNQMQEFNNKPKREREQNWTAVIVNKHE